MATKKKSNRANGIGLGKLLLSFPVFLFVFLAPLAVAVELAKYLHLTLYRNFAFSLNILGILLARQVLAKLQILPHPRPRFSNRRDEVVNAISYILFFVIAFLPANANYSPSVFSFLFSFIFAGLATTFFSYVLGTDELKQRIRDFPKGFKRKKPRKRKLEISRELPPEHPIENRPD